jgi:DNA-binding NtrC family response regulator
MEKSILIVDDEFVIALDFQDVLERAGYKVIGPSSRVAPTLELIRGNRIDAAILDANLGRAENPALIARELKERNIPFAVVTGYAIDQLPPELSSQEVIGKPIMSSQLVDVVGRLLDRELMQRGRHA